MKKYKAPLLIIAAGFCWGIIGLFSKQLSARGFTPVQITETRCLVTALSLVVYILITDREKLKIKPGDLWIFLGTGILSIAFFNICYFNAIEASGLSAAAILLYTSPFFVLVLSAIFFKERLTAVKISALLIAFTGCALAVGFIGTGGRITAEGLVYGVLSGLGYGLYSIFGRVALKKYHTLTVTAYTFIVASAGLLPFCSAGEIVNICAEKPTALLFTLLLGIISTLIPFLCYTKGLSLTDTGTAAIIAYLEPLVATACGMIIFKEEINVIKITGILLILISIIILNFKPKVKRKSDEYH
ncbi:MAG: EamA family transporter [Ruminiclostridium sp.]|nr:EamA family transporter [Ruminiclostridium sp.]